MVLLPLLENQEWYQALIEECRANLAEAEFQTRWSLIEGYHRIGKLILEAYPNFEREKIYGEKIVQSVAKSLSRSPRSIYYAIGFAKRFEKLDEMPEGKTITWSGLVRKYLTDKSDRPEDVVGRNYPHFHRCSTCGLWKIEAEKKYLCKCEEL